MILAKSEHTHLQRLLAKKTREKEDELIKAASAMPTVTPRSVFGSITEQLDNESSGI